MVISPSKIRLNSKEMGMMHYIRLFVSQIRGRSQYDHISPVFIPKAE